MPRRKLLTTKALHRSTRDGRISEMDNSELKSRLDKLISELQQVRNAIDAGEPQMPAAAVREMAEEICLSCKKKISAAERKDAQRGNHAKCYARNMRAIKAGETTDRDLIEHGLWAIKKSPGRKRVLPSRLPRRRDQDGEV